MGRKCIPPRRSMWCPAYLRTRHHSECCFPIRI